MHYHIRCFEGGIRARGLFPRAWVEHCYLASLSPIPGIRYSEMGCAMQMSRRRLPGSCEARQSQVGNQPAPRESTHPGEPASEVQFHEAIWSSWDFADGESTTTCSSTALELDDEELHLTSSLDMEVGWAAPPRTGRLTEGEFLTAQSEDDSSVLRYCRIHEPNNGAFARWR